MPNVQQDAHRTLQFAIANHQAGDLTRAEKLYQQILAFEPRNADALHLLGVLAGQRGQSDRAIELITQAIGIRPDFADAMGNLANALRDLGRSDEAIGFYRKAIALMPDFPEAYGNLANALRVKGNLDESIASYRQAIALKPDFAEAHRNLGIVLHERGDFDGAVASYRRAIALNPNSPQMHHSLGMAWHHLRSLGNAIACYRQALALKADYPEALTNLGNALKESGQIDEAILYYQQGLGMRQDFAEAHYNLGNAWKDSGRLDDAIASYRRAIELNSAFVGAHDNLLYLLLSHPDSTSQSLYVEGQRWKRQHAEPLNRFIQRHSNDPDPFRRLRIGYAGNFGDHPVGRFMLPLLASHDRADFQVFCYAQSRARDSMTARLQEQADTWRSIADVSDEQAAEIIRHDRIDILVDLAMHAGGNRLLVFARKPAPVQVTYLAYAGGAALDTIDYRLTDCYLDPDAAEDKYYNQESLRLPGSYWCYLQTTPTPPVSELPASMSGRITLGCLNNFFKVTPQLLATWSILLRRLAGSRLLLHSRAGRHRDQVFEFLHDRGIAPDRIEMVDRVSPEEYFKTYNRIDIGLDTHPYAGGTTTCDALWMGVPVVTLAGRTAVGRGGVSILTNAGLPELIAQTPEQYVEIAATLAADLPRLADLRSTLRQRMSASPLMDAPSFARNVETIYRAIWRRWCAEASNSA